MTNTELRAMRQAGNSTWEVLAALVHSGVEYPDAVWRVTQALRLDREEAKEMERDYDECC